MVKVKAKSVKIKYRPAAILLNVNAMICFKVKLRLVSDVYWTVHRCDNLRIKKKQLDATYYFIVLLVGSTCFGHYYAHQQELATMMLITTLVVSFSKDGGVIVSVNLWFLVVCVRCEVVCSSW